MEPIQLLVTVVVLAILAEVTYLVVKLPRQNISKKQSRPIFVDTSVLIDGRIIAVAESGFIGDTLVIPRSVIGELQFLADNADHEKRSRARHGLDIVKQLQQMPGVAVEIMQDGSKADEGVDERLLTLAKKYDGAICTIDYNLNKVAVVEDIAVLNVNELAKSLRMAYLPGERILLDLVQKGQDSHQAIGHLTDGTMVVVEQASKLVGQTIEVEFIRSLQTAAGKMMFARPTEVKKHEPANKKPAGKKPVDTSKQKAQPKQRTATQATPGVYHSDEREHVRATTHRQEKTSNANKHTSKTSRPQNNPRTANVPKRKRPKTSSEREAALIDLVEKS